MKKIVIFGFMLGSLITTMSGQDSRYKLSSGAGYYLDTFGRVGGQIIWIEGGIKTKTQFYLNARISMSYIDWIMSEGVFAGHETMALRKMVDLTLSRSLKLRSNHYLEPSFGFKLKKENSLYPIYEYINNQPATSYNSEFYELGLTLCLDYHYVFESGFFVGLRSDINVIYACGFEGLTISPLIGFRF